MGQHRENSMHPRRLTQHAAAGFTLIELLITIAIVAILAAIAVSSYQDQIVKSRRAAAASCWSVITRRICLTRMLPRRTAMTKSGRTTLNLVLVQVRRRRLTPCRLSPPALNFPEIHYVAR